MYKCKYSFRWFVHKDPYLVTKYPIWFEQDVSYWAEVIVFILHYEFAFELRFWLEKIAFVLTELYIRSADDKHAFLEKNQIHVTAIEESLFIFRLNI